ncbi:MAG TPA: hypothetical protein VMG12_32130 [Polyangiaceae bacterium]|nr:hypothetical protein [Polyangiaceae bacterium]
MTSRQHSKARRQRLWLGLLALSPIAWPAATPIASAEEVTGAEPALRYPFDPVCPWGRVADGRGILVRCLDAAEAQRLAAPARAASPAPTPAASAPPPASPAPVAEPRRPVEAPALAASAPAPKPSSRKVVLERVSAARADTGELPEARTQLVRANDRYLACVDGNGGITSSPASVTVRFLVRERGRAEGVSVKERTGLSMAAAKCVASVIDRRFVGYPAAPIVGADLTIDFAWEGAGR